MLRARSRARCRIACWKPPQVPRNGIACSRALPIAAITRSGSVYGLPGTTQRPSKPLRSSASVLGIQYGSSTSPSRRRSASISSGMRPWARTAGERSPTSASLAEVMPSIVAARRRSRPTMFHGVSITDTDGRGPSLPADVRARGAARLVLSRRARARLHAVRGIAAHRRAGGRRRRGAALTTAGGADRGGRTAARARRADPAAARRRPRRRRARGRRPAVGVCGSARRRWRRPSPRSSSRPAWP